MGDGVGGIAGDVVGELNEGEVGTADGHEFGKVLGDEVGEKARGVGELVRYVVGDVVLSGSLQ